MFLILLLIFLMFFIFLSFYFKKAFFAGWKGLKKQKCIFSKIGGFSHFLYVQLYIF